MQIALPMCAKQSKSSCVFFSFFWVPFQSWCGRVPGKPKTPWVLNIHIFSWSPNGWFRDFGRFCRWGTTKNKVFAGLKHPIDIQKSSTQGGFLKLRQFLVAGFWGGWKGLDVQAPESTYTSPCFTHIRTHILATWSNPGYPASKKGIRSSGYVPACSSRYQLHIYI